METKAITVEATVNAPVEKVWTSWTEPAHIMKWNQASEDWHSPASVNDLRVGGSFTTTMAARDGSFSFDFSGTYDAVIEHELIEYTMSDGRKVRVVFSGNGDTTRVTETFDPETENSIELQQAGWQAILDSFKRYTEAL